MNRYERYAKIIEFIKNPYRKRPIVRDIYNYLVDDGYTGTRRTIERDVNGGIEQDWQVEIIRKGNHPDYWYEIIQDPNDGQPMYMSYVEHAAMSSILEREMKQPNLNQSKLILDSPFSIGWDLIPKLLPALEKNRMIEIEYHKFNGDVDVSTIEPHFLKLFRKRWYLIAYDGSTLKSYGLDRLKNFTELEKRFERDPRIMDNYRHVIGFYENDEDPVRIRFWSQDYNANYLRTLPLHHSQKELGPRNGGYEFEIYVVPNFEFMQEILRNADNIKVLEPRWVVDEINERVKRIYSFYN